MNVLIIEDEPLAAKDLERLLQRLTVPVQIIANVSGVADALDWFSKNQMPDLIFSDIRLSDGISFEIFEKQEITCPIIFTTAYDEYAMRAFKLNSIDYLLKPIDSKELEAAIKKYQSLSVNTVLSAQLKGMIGRWQEPLTKKYKERFLVTHRNALVPVPEGAIACFHKAELIYLHTINGEKYVSEHATLDELEALVNPEKFFRVNRQYLVHIQVVSKIKTTHKGLTVELKVTPPLELEISREKATAFKSWIA